jgi:hypothetical protein
MIENQAVCLSFVLLEKTEIKNRNDDVALVWCAMETKVFAL